MSRKSAAIDWDAIERDYRVGQLSLRALASKHSVTAGAISKKAKARGWVQDASQEVRERTRAALVSAPVPPEAGSGNTVSIGRNVPTRADIDTAVSTNLTIIHGHRSDIAAGRGLVGMLFDQLGEAAQARAEIEETIDRETADDSNGQRRARMLRAVSLPAHAAVLRDLSTALKNLIPLERQAFNLDETSATETYEQRLQRLYSGEATS